MHLQRIMSAILIGVLATGSTLAGQGADQESTAWQRFVMRLPPGASVEVRMKDGHRVRGIVVEATADSFIIKPATRVPVPTVPLAFSDIDSVKLWKEGMPPGVKVLLGVGVGVGAVFLAALIAFASWD